MKLTFKLNLCKGNVNFFLPRSGSGSVWTFSGTRKRIHKKTYADSKH